jgi:ferredoxin
MAPNGLPVVDFDACTACGDCVEACPKDLFEILPATHRLIVQCRSLLSGAAAEEYCRVACTGCGICASDAPQGLIEMRNTLPVIDRNQPQLETEIATLRCPTGAIQWIERQQFEGLLELPVVAAIPD